MLAACAALVASCNNGGKSATPANAADSTAIDTLTYKGMGPAADGTYEYTLSLYGDSIRECAYLAVGVTPKGRDTVAMTTGVANVISKDGNTYYRVSANKEDSVTFLQLNDTTLRLVGNDFQGAAIEAMNADLKLVK